MALCVGYTGLAQIGQTTVLATSGSYSEQIRTIISSASQNGNIISKKHYAIDYPNVTASITYQLQKGKSNSDFFGMPNEIETLIIKSGETKNLSGYLTSASVSATLGSVINVSFSLVNCKIGNNGSIGVYEPSQEGLVPYYSTNISLGQSTSWSLNANREVQFLKSCDGTTSITSADYVGFGMRDRSGSAQLVIGGGSNSGSGGSNSGSGTSTVTFTFDGSITFDEALINTQSINIQTGSNLTVKNVNILQVG